MKMNAMITGAAGLLVLTTIALAQPSLVSRYEFKKLEYPGSLFSYPLGINDKREAVGVYADMQGVFHGYLWRGGAFTKIEFPGARQAPMSGTYPGGINNRGDIVGTYTDAQGYQHGFMRARPASCENDEEERCAPVYTTIDNPAAVQTQIFFELGPGLGTAAIGINNHGVITGMYATAGLFSDGFLLSHGVFTPVDHPIASHMPGGGSKCFSISNNGVAACDYSTNDGITHGFLFKNGKFEAVDVPGSAQGGFGTQINGVNDSGVAVGLFSSAPNVYHTLVWVSGKVFTLDFPGEPFSELHSINNRGDISGAYLSDPTTFFLHGFLAFRKDE